MKTTIRGSGVNGSKETLKCRAAAPGGFPKDSAEGGGATQKRQRSYIRYAEATSYKRGKKDGISTEHAGQISRPCFFPLDKGPCPP